MTGRQEYNFSALLLDENISYGIVQPGFHTEIDSVPIVRVNNIKGGKIQTNDVLKVSSAIEQKYQRTRLEGGELLITVVGSIGECAIVPDSLKGWNVARAVSVARIKKDFDKRYIKYCFKSEDIKFQMYGKTNDTVQPTLNLSSLKSLVLSIPSLPEQKAIAAVLSSLDDKIDLLYRQNQTLEAMAASLFRQWFVEESQEDWDEVKLGDFFPVVTGKRDANFSIDDGEYPFFTCSQAALKAPSFSFEGAAILLTGNGDFNVKRFIGKFEAYQRTYVLIPYDIKYFSFLYTLMRFYLAEITGGHQGSVINFITKGMITEFKFNLPNEHINIDEKLAQFNELYEKIDSNNFQIKTLEKLRDTLLPKLMSGEVRVTC
jgi:type I restriction enzyme S subunit